MTKTEKLNWTIAIVGLIASLISIFAFVTGASSVRSFSSKPAAAIPPPPVNPPVVSPPGKKQDTLGDKATAPIRNGVNWIGGRLKVHH